MSLTSMAPTDEAKFTQAERQEIITRLQVVENVCSGISAQLSDLTASLFPEADVAEGELPYRVNLVQEVHEFACKLALTIDAMTANPMIAAMMPPPMEEEG